MTNRAAIGARVSVTANGFTQTQEIDGGHGRYTTQRDQTLHFGVGAACEAEVTIRWPDRALTTQRFTLGAGYGYRVEMRGNQGPIRCDGRYSPDGGRRIRDDARARSGTGGRCSGGIVRVSRGRFPTFRLVRHRVSVWRAG